MKFLPDSAVLGTLGRLKHAGKSRRRKGVAQNEKKEGTVLAQNWDAFEQDFRSFDELLAEAKRHALEKEKAEK
jgi:hypothetical protein